MYHMYCTNLYCTNIHTPKRCDLLKCTKNVLAKVVDASDNAFAGYLDGRYLTFCFLVCGRITVAHIRIVRYRNSGRMVPGTL